VLEVELELLLPHAAVISAASTASAVSRILHV
jgi:hypothetical protein